MEGGGRGDARLVYDGGRAAGPERARDPNPIATKYASSYSNYTRPPTTHFKALAKNARLLDDPTG